MRVWRVRISYDESFENVIKDYLVQYNDRYDEAMVEDAERIKLFEQSGSGAHFVFFSVTCASGEQNEKNSDLVDDDDFIDFLEYICDKLCKYRDKVESQDEFDDICSKCKIQEL